MPLNRADLFNPGELVYEKGRTLFCVATHPQSALETLHRVLHNMPAANNKKPTGSAKGARAELGVKQKRALNCLTMLIEFTDARQHGHADTGGMQAALDLTQPEHCAVLFSGQRHLQWLRSRFLNARQDESVTEQDNANLVHCMSNLVYVFRHYMDKHLDLKDFDVAGWLEFLIEKNDAAAVDRCNQIASDWWEAVTPYYPMIGITQYQGPSEHFRECVELANGLNDWKFSLLNQWLVCDLCMRGSTQTCRCTDILSSSENVQGWEMLEQEDLWDDLGDQFWKDRERINETSDILTEDMGHVQSQSSNHTQTEVHECIHFKWPTETTGLAGTYTRGATTLHEHVLQKDTSIPLKLYLKMIKAHKWQIICIV